uniref:Uncharacterized protein n=1 Tax=Triticum urartu TaxID=4572 RepID=A0A8R7UNX5_TRIUA
PLLTIFLLTPFFFESLSGSASPLQPYPSAAPGRCRRPPMMIGELLEDLLLTSLDSSR